MVAIWGRVSHAARVFGRPDGKKDEQTDGRTDRLTARTARLMARMAHLTARTARLTALTAEPATASSGRGT